MGRTITEAKLSDYVQIVFERSRNTNDQLVIRMRIQANAVTAAGEVVKTYSFDDLMERLPAAKATALQNFVSDLIDDMATRLGIASS